MLPRQGLLENCSSIRSALNAACATRCWTLRIRTVTKPPSTARPATAASMDLRAMDSVVVQAHSTWTPESDSPRRSKLVHHASYISLENPPIRRLFRMPLQIWHWTINVVLETNSSNLFLLNFCQFVMTKLVSICNVEYFSLYWSR